MEAIVKATGEIVHVTYIGNGKYVTDRPNDYHHYDYEEIEELPDDYDCVQYNPDYWTRLEHQTAIAAMQGALANNDLLMQLLKRAKSGSRITDVASEFANACARTFVEKLKEKEE